jgi:hypothetical protein
MISLSVRPSGNAASTSARRFSLLLPFALAVIPLCSVNSKELSDTLNKRVLRYCNDNMGKSVGNGQCAALAVQALKAAGARPKEPQGYPAWNDYVWGKEVCMIEGTADGTRVASGSLDDVEPGDIAQFSQVKFLKMHAAHHTAIVDYINSKHLGLIQQNFGGKHGPVFKGAVRADKLEHGWIRFYRPLTR